MSSWTDLQAQLIVQAYDFSRFDTVIDVGGGHGGLVLKILAPIPVCVRSCSSSPKRSPPAVPGWKPAVLATGVRQCLATSSSRCPPAATPMCSSTWCETGTTSTRKPSSATATEPCIRAYRLLLIDAMMDPRSGRDRLVKLLDLESSVLLGGRIRTRDELERLLASSGFRLGKVRSTGLVDSLVLECHLARTAPVA